MKNIRGIFELGYVLAITQFKVRNEGSYLGILWYLLDPLIFFTVIIIARGAAFPADVIENFPVYLMIGLLFLHLFTKTTTEAIGVVNKYQRFIKNLKLPFEALVLSVVLKNIFSHIFEIILLVIVMIVTGGVFWGFLVYPFILFFFAVFLLGVSFLLVPIGAYVKDFANIWSPLSRVLLFATPIFYAASPGTLTYLLSLFNPIFHYMTATRLILIEGVLPPMSILVGMVTFAMVTFIFGLFVFKRTNHRFAEL